MDLASTRFNWWLRVNSIIMRMRLCTSPPAARLLPRGKSSLQKARDKVWRFWPLALIRWAWWRILKPTPCLPSVTLLSIYASRLICEFAPMLSQPWHAFVIAWPMRSTSTFMRTVFTGCIPPSLQAATAKEPAKCSESVPWIWPTCHAPIRETLILPRIFLARKPTSRCLANSMLRVTVWP